MRWTFFTDTPGIVAGSVGSPIGTSDHSFVSANIKTEQAAPEISFSRKVYLKSQAGWNGIENDLANISWPEIYRQDNCIATLNAAFVELIDKHIPSRLVHFRNKDKAWFNYDCRRAHLAKQEAYRLWQRNRSDLTWANYTRLRAVAQNVYTSAERDYNEGIKDTLLGATNSHKWWSTFKSALFGVDTSIPPLLKPDGTVTHCPKEKANLFADVFDEKQSNENLTMPHSCDPEAKLTTLALRSRENKNLLLNLDAYGSAGPDGIFPLFFIKSRVMKILPCLVLVIQRPSYLKFLLSFVN